MRRSAAHVALCTLVLVLAGFVAPAWGAISAGVVQTDALESLSFPVHTLRELKLQRAFRRTWHQQFDFSCGSAALATLLTFHYDAPIDETSVFKAMFAVGDQPQIRAKGFSLLDMKKFLESRGYKADGVRSSLDTLISVGVPAIALISDHGYRHFVVVKGADHDRVLLGDPALIFGRRVPDQHSLRLDNPHGSVITPREDDRRGEGNAGRECRAFENSTFHNESNVVANATAQGKLVFYWLGNL